MSYDINILVNGNRCKQYHHNGRIFIEAKEGSEYAIEIKNNEWNRILAVCSVDGLDILNGKPAVEGGPGYVINQLNSSRFDGFRVSDDKVAKFIFDYKGSSYAASKGNGAEKNVGVIGVRLFQEKVKPEPIHIHHWNVPNNPWYYDGTPKPYYPSSPTIWCDTTFTRSSLEDTCYGSTLDMASDEDSPTRRFCGNTMKSTNLNGNSTVNNAAMFFNSVQENPRGFDMGTKWGEAKESKVVEVEFERGILALTTNIYYASRQSLLEMGVPLGNEKQVSFPEPFADSKYAKPPTNWRG